jgi:hypothetical protein
MRACLFPMQSAPRFDTRFRGTVLLNSGKDD